VEQAVPELRSSVIEAVKDKALSSAPKFERSQFRSLRSTSNARRSFFSKMSGFLHPGGYMGPAEIAQMQAKLATGSELQTVAKRRLLTVSWVVVLYERGWAVSSACNSHLTCDHSCWKNKQTNKQARKEQKYGIEIPVNAGVDDYGGPYPMATFQADYCERFFYGVLVCRLCLAAAAERIKRN